MTINAAGAAIADILVDDDPARPTTAQKLVRVGPVEAISDPGRRPFLLDDLSAIALGGTADLYRAR